MDLRLRGDDGKLSVVVIGVVVIGCSYIPHPTSHILAVIILNLAVPKLSLTDHIDFLVIEPERACRLD
jgi:hypothetical protein